MSVLTSANQPIRSWSRAAKLLVSLVIVVHLLAVVAEPFRFFTYSPSRGTSPAADPIRIALAPYIEFAFLNHGYFFFAPEPGPSHLIQGTLTHADGSQSTVRYPDKSAQWPRLLYHRHFMLSEFLNQLHVPPVDAVIAQQSSDQQAREWASNRRRYEDVRNSMQAHLIARYSATSASIERIRHILPGSDAVLNDGQPLDDASLYILLPDVLEPPPPATSVPQPSAALPVAPTWRTSPGSFNEPIEARP
ncbi:MAG: hypothetical protein KF752_15660 [Pirellulaceae bacterium]|nr:hypothetical protein [Pirellulaceae bacterium]